MTLQKNLCSSLCNFRKMRGQSITDFAQEMGISKSELQKLLKDDANPRLDTIEHIAHNLEIEPELLISSTYSCSDNNSALLLIKTIDCFTNLPEDDQERAASILHELINIFTKAKAATDECKW